MAEEAKRQGREENKGKNKIFFFMPMLVLILLAGGGGAYFFLLKKDEKKEAGIPLNSEVGIWIDLGTFTVNLADTQAEVYAKVSITIEVSNERVRAEVQKRIPIIKDAIIDILSSKTSTILKSSEGREALRLEIIRRINTILLEGGVRNVYFTDFIVQST